MRRDKTYVIGSGTARSALILCLLMTGNPLMCGDTTHAGSVELARHNGRPTLFIDGQPDGLPVYCPAPNVPSLAVLERTSQRFFQHQMGAYMLSIPRAPGGHWQFQFWVGDEISSVPLLEARGPDLDEQVRLVLEGDPAARIIVRFNAHEPEGWLELHPHELFVNELGERLPVPSLASELYWQRMSEFCTAVVEYAESRPWADRIIGYANFHRLEGLHEPLIFAHWLFDHSPVMTERWRRYLRENYETVEALRAAHGDESLTFETVQVPRDQLRGSVPEVSALLYWQSAKDNQPLRDYLLLCRELFHDGSRRMQAAMRSATQREPFFVHDAMKQTMAGWNIPGFFERRASWLLAYPEANAGSGAMDVAELFDDAGFDGLVTPHDYQARGLGGVFEPEGVADSMVLRGKLFLAEMDTRTYTGGDPPDDYGKARDIREFSAITWRNVATALTRGFHFYWMDLHTDWFGDEAMHEVVSRQVQVVKDSVNWPHETLPGIAVILDDSAPLETNGSGNFLNEAVMWELKMGLARCGVPYRIYLLQDLELENFPAHRLFYFPSLFRIDERRLALLHEKVFRDGNVVVWGPGSGISDGRNIGTASAARLTGFSLDMLPVNDPRRTLVSNAEHPITRDVPAETVIGGPLAYGPVLFPTDGIALGLAWTKQGRVRTGLAVKSFGQGAAGDDPDGPLGAGDWSSVFTTAVPLPATLWRALARYSGTHIWSESGDVLVADRSVVALHSVMSGQKRISLPGRFRVRDLVRDQVIAEDTEEIIFDLEAPETRVFLMEPIQ
jgi:hypothetical protein